MLIKQNVSDGEPGNSWTLPCLQRVKMKIIMYHLVTMEVPASSQTFLVSSSSEKHAQIPSTTDGKPDWKVEAPASSCSQLPTKLAMHIEDETNLRSINAIWCLLRFCIHPISVYTVSLTSSLSVWSI